MPRRENPQETQIPNRLKRAPLRPRNCIRLQRRSREGACAGVGNHVRGREPAEPVADPVGVAGPDEGREACLHDGAEGGQEGAGVWGVRISRVF